jgi:hypothetical protein
MSRIVDMKERIDMPFKEKYTWVSLVASVVVAGVYFVFVLGQVGETPVAEIAYQVPMLVAIAVFAALTIVGTIVMGIGTGIAIELTGEGSTEDIGRDDERDQEIQTRGQVAGSWVAAVGALGALALAMVRYDQFWIANAIYAAFVASTITTAVVKLVAYRRGF